MAIQCGGACSGLPPYSCTAFGDWARLKFRNPNECDPCDKDQTGTIVLVVVMILMVILALTLYILIILRYPEALRRCRLSRSSRAVRGRA